LDRFQATCPADPSCIEQFDPSLIQKKYDEEGTENSVWVAVYRSNQNQPSVFVRDEFFHVMSVATTMDTSSSSASSSSSFKASWPEKLQTPLARQKPVAVAQLRASPDYEGKGVIDSLRCALKKEDTDEACDGGSEFLEALGVGLDSLVLHHLKKQSRRDGDDESTISFEGAIRTKATLFSNRLLEERGFSPVENLSRDMATHISSLDGCLQKYAERSVDTSLSMEARDRALQIVSILGQMDRPKEGENSNDEDDGDDFDPWANIKMQI